MFQVALHYYFCMQVQQKRACQRHCIGPSAQSLTCCQLYRLLVMTLHCRLKDYCTCSNETKEYNQQLPKARSVMDKAAYDCVTGKAPGKVCCHGLHQLGQLPDLTDLPFPPKLQSGDCPQQSSFPQALTETPGSCSDPAHPYA